MRSPVPHNGYPCSVREGKIIESNGITVDTLVDPLFSECFGLEDFLNGIEEHTMEYHRKFMQDWWNGMDKKLEEISKPHKPK